MATKHLSAADIAVLSHLHDSHKASLQDVQDKLDFLLYMSFYLPHGERTKTLDRVIDELVDLHEAMLKANAS